MVLLLSSKRPAFGYMGVVSLDRVLRSLFPFPEDGLLSSNRLSNCLLLSLSEGGLPLSQAASEEA